MNSEYSFVQLADTQFGMVSEEAAEITPAGTPGPGKFLPAELRHLTQVDIYEIELNFTKKAIKYINSMVPQPKFVVVCGDLVNAAPTRSIELNQKQVQDFKKIFSKLNKTVKLVCVCGNHDIGDVPTVESIQIYRQNFGKEYFTFTVDNDKFIVINSQIYKSTEHIKKVAAEHNTWLDSELASNNQYRHAVLFSHIPPFINDPYEPSEYFNYDQETRMEMLSKAVDNNVRYWFCGHYHRNAGGIYSKGDKSLEVITTAALGGNVISNKEGNVLGISGVGKLVLKQNLSGLRIVQVKQDSISHVFKTLDELGIQ